ncbi:MAG: chaperonin [Lachnospiraceae bacterium]|nr:chaperonin [Lachnospiraceae bacterium]
MNYRTRRIILIVLVSILLLVTICFMGLLLFDKELEPVLSQLRETEAQTAVETEAPQPATEYVQTEAETQIQTEAQTEAETEDPLIAAMESIYTFSQGPVAWERKTPYSGEWCEFEMEGGRFSVFGCGLCALANIYSSLTPYECSPVDMYKYAMRVSDYSPSWGYGAIDWPFMGKTLRSAGFKVAFRKKDRTYEEFRAAYRNSLTAIVLISSKSDDTYWQDTPGHYVDPWLYDEQTDMIFLGDSGNPDHNRHWVPLRYLYDAMAYDSSWQYMLVRSYDDTKNTWKYSGITEACTYPSYYTPKPAHEALG